MSEIIKIENLKKSFGKFQALKDVTFTVNAGEVVGFLGPNGAGLGLRCLEAQAMQLADTADDPGNGEDDTPRSGQRA